MNLIKKRIISVLLVMSFAIMLTGCSRCPHTDITEATCVDCAACVKCGQTFGKPIGHSTNSGYCYRCNNYVNCLKLDEKMVGAIEEKCLDTDFVASVDTKAIEKSLGVEFIKETAQISAGYQKNEYLYNIELSIQAKGKDKPYVISRNFFAIEDTNEATGWSIDFHDIAIAPVED